MRFTYDQPLRLESGLGVPAYHLEYTTHGNLNETGDNVVWIFHALTANSDPAEWWPGLVGAGRLFDPSIYYIVCVNMPGSCYGSIGPLDPDPRTGQPYYHDFPVFTPRDMIRAYQPLREFLGIRKIQIGAGGSMGGQQLLEWAIEEPALFGHIVLIATNGRHSPWGIAFNTAQRLHQRIGHAAHGGLREHHDDDLAVHGGLENEAAAFELVAERGGVGQVAIVRDGDLAARTIHRERLGVAEIGRAGRGIARVADGHFADEVVQDFRVVKNLRHEAHAVVLEEFAIVAGDNAGALLPAMLQGEEAVVGENGGVRVAENGENAALMGRFVVLHAGQGEA